LADAHLAAVDAILAGERSAGCYNVGTGRGASVLEVIDTARAITGLDLPYEVVAPRPVDPPAVVADPALIQADLGWKAQHDLTAMIASAWTAWPRRLAA
jgi:UDP-glucose 4-epimerase